MTLIAALVGRQKPGDLWGWGHPSVQRECQDSQGWYTGKQNNPPKTQSHETRQQNPQNSLANVKKILKKRHIIPSLNMIAVDILEFQQVASVYV